MKLIHNIFKPLRAIRCEMQWNAITLSLCPCPNHIWQVVLIHIETKVKTVKENLFFFDRFSYETLIFLTTVQNWNRSAEGSIDYWHCSRDNPNGNVLDRKTYFRTRVCRVKDSFLKIQDSCSSELNRQSGSVVTKNPEGVVKSVRKITEAKI